MSAIQEILEKQASWAKAVNVAHQAAVPAISAGVGAYAAGEDRRLMGAAAGAAAGYAGEKLVSRAGEKLRQKWLMKRWGGGPKSRKLTKGLTVDQRMDLAKRDYEIASDILALTGGAAGGLGALGAGSLVGLGNPKKANLRSPERIGRLRATWESIKASKNLIRGTGDPEQTRRSLSIAQAFGRKKMGRKKSIEMMREFGSDFGSDVFDEAVRKGRSNPFTRRNVRKSPGMQALLREGFPGMAERRELQRLSQKNPLK